MGDLLLALQKERRTLTDRQHIIEVSLKNDAIKTPYTEVDLVWVKERVQDVEAAIDAVKIRRKCQPITELNFTAHIKVKDLRAALSHPDDQEKRLWTYDQQGTTFDNVVGIKQEQYDGKPTITLLINVLPDGKK